MLASFQACWTHCTLAVFCDTKLDWLQKGKTWCFDHFDQQIEEKRTWVGMLAQKFFGHFSLANVFRGGDRQTDSTGISRQKIFRPVASHCVILAAKVVVLVDRCSNKLL